jgi:hypothetical protein
MNCDTEEVVVDCCKILFMYLLGNTEEKQGKQLEYPAT